MPFREKVLALDGALRRCGAWVVSGETILAGREADGERRQAAHLSAMARDVLAATGLTAGDLGLQSRLGRAVSPGFAPPWRWRMGWRWAPVCRLLV